MQFKLDSKTHLKNMDWFARNSNLASIPLKWEELAQYNLPSGILERMKEWEFISKSPYSNSFYSSKDVTFESKPDGSMRVSDHWNFTSRRDGKVHSKTDIVVENNTQWCIGVFNETKRHYKIIYSEADPTHVAVQKYRRELTAYLKDPATINRKRLFATKIDNHEIHVEMNYNGREFVGLLHKYTGVKIAIIPESYNKEMSIKDQILYSNNELIVNNINKLILKDELGNILEDPYIIPEHLKVSL